MCSSCICWWQGEEPGPAERRALEDEPLLAARMVVEDCMCLLLDVDDIDRLWAAGEHILLCVKHQELGYNLQLMLLNVDGTNCLWGAGEQNSLRMWASLGFCGGLEGWKQRSINAAKCG